MIKVLLWGSVSNIYILGLVKNVFLANPCYEVYVLDTQMMECDLDNYIALGVHVIKSPPEVVKWYENKKRGGPVVALCMHFRRLRTIIKNYSFDIINFHFVDPLNLIGVWVLKNFLHSKLILSYWGSDLLRTPDYILKSEKMFVRGADYVSFENDDLKYKFRQIYNSIKEHCSETIYFGLSILDEIRIKSDYLSRESIRGQLGIHKDKIVVAVGYNAIPQQQHIYVIEQMTKLKQEIKDKIVILLQMTYPLNDEYREQVRKAVSESGCEYIVLSDYLSDERVAEYRLITDIFINSQTTDAFSGTVCECLYSGAVLINARWLRYPELEKFGLEYIEFNSFGEIPILITDCINNRENKNHNSDIMMRLRSWESCAPKWQKMYYSVLEKKG